jgi:hypothetical protein
MGKLSHRRCKDKPEVSHAVEEIGPNHHLQQEKGKWFIKTW